MVVDLFSFSSIVRLTSVLGLTQHDQARRRTALRVCDCDCDCEEERSRRTLVRHGCWPLVTVMPLLLDFFPRWECHLQSYVLLSFSLLQ